MVKASDSLHEAESRRRPLHQLARQPRQMHRGDGRRPPDIPARNRAPRSHPCELRIGRAKPSAHRGHVAVDGKGRAGQRRGAQRRFVQPLARILEAAAVAREHLDIGQQMMAEGDRLGRLHMGEAGHDGGGVRFGLRQQRALQRQQALHRRARRPPAPRAGNPSPPDRCASARCAAVPPPAPMISASRASILRWMSSSSRLKTNLPSAISCSIWSRPLQDGLGVVLGDDPFAAPACAHGRGEPARSSRRQALVEIDGGGNLPHDLGGTGFKPPAPHLVRRHRRITPEAPCRTAICSHPSWRFWWPSAFYMGSGTHLSTQSPSCRRR